MQYREIEHTINVNAGNSDLPVDIDGEIRGSDVLAQLFGEARRAFREDDVDQEWQQSRVQRR